MADYIGCNFEDVAGPGIGGNWNEFNDGTTTGVMSADLIDLTTGLGTGRTLTLNTAFTGEAYSGSVATAGAGGFAEELFEGNFYAEAAASGNSITMSATNGETYTIEIAGHFGNAARDTNFSVTGAASNPYLYDSAGTGVPNAPVTITGTVTGSGVTITTALVDFSSYLSFFTIQFASPQSITSINGGSAVTDGQQDVAVIATGFSVLPTAGVYDDDATGTFDTTVTASLAGTATNFTFDTPSVKDYTVATLGTPFTTASHAISATFTKDAETATGAFTLNPATNWNVVEVNTPITTEGSLFYVAGGWDLSAAVNADQVYYYSTEIVTDTDPAYFVIAANGTITTNITTGSVPGQFFDQTDGKWYQFTVQLGLEGTSILNMYSLFKQRNAL